MKNKLLTLSALLLIGLGAYANDSTEAKGTNIIDATSSTNVKQLCEKLTPSQRTLAQANGINVDALCAKAQTSNGINGGRQVTVVPRKAEDDNQSQQKPTSLNEENTNVLAQLKTLAEVAQNQKGDGLMPFGYDLFAGEPNSFTPATDIPVPKDYVIGPGDTLKVYLFGKETDSLTTQVDRDGVVHLPDVGPVTVAGLPFGDVQTLLEEQIKAKVIGVSKVMVTLEKLRTIRVFVLGDAYQPGSYVVSALSTISHVLTVSGGIRETGSLRTVLLKRRGETIASLDLYDFLLKGDTSHDIRVQPGDAVFVAPIGPIVAVGGEVVRPAIYELKNEKTLSEVISLAGGLKPAAFPKAVHITRQDKANGLKTSFTVDLSTPEGRKFKVVSGDEIHVSEVADDKMRVVRVVGHVYHAREYGWNDSMRLTDVLPGISQLKPDPELAIAIIMREIPQTRQIYPVYVYPRQASEHPTSDQNIRLHPNDTLIILGHSKPRHEVLAPYLKRLQAQAGKDTPKPTVSISGAVRFPGTYPLAEGATAKDLLLLAGGFAESAQLQSAELSRQVIYPDHTADIEHRKFNWSTPPKLTPGDAVNVPAIGRFGVERMVEIRGEVRSPGQYVIRDGETLKELIERAGGLTKKAFPEGAIFSRARLRQLEAQALARLEAQLKQESLAQTISADNARQSSNKGTTATGKQIASLINETKPIGRMVIDLPGILAGRAEDLKLDDGDMIVIPARPDSVTVLGQVQYPTSHVYDASVSVTEYIQRSGGLTYNADENRIFIIHANGAVSLPQKGGWFGSEVQLKPGDAIVVPIDLDYMKPLDLWTSITQIIYQSAVAIAAVGTL